MGSILLSFGLCTIRRIEPTIKHYITSPLTKNSKESNFELLKLSPYTNVISIVAFTYRDLDENNIGLLTNCSVCDG
jgi:hypothetical protein